MPKTASRQTPAKRQSKANESGLTGEAIEAAKKELGSWRAVAERFALGSPSNARKKFTELTGRSHTELNATPGGGRRLADDGTPRPTRRQRAIRYKPEPITIDPLSQNTTSIAESITGRTLVIRRGTYDEELEVLRVKGFHVVEKAGKAASLSVEPGDLCVQFVEGHLTKDGNLAGTGHTRTVAIKQIWEVKG